MRMWYLAWLFLASIGSITLSYTAHAERHPRYEFDIKSQPVGSAIVEFAAQRDLNIVFLTKLAKAQNANELKGKYTLSDALITLFKGTDLRASITNNRLIKIEKIAKKKPPFKVRRKYTNTQQVHKAEIDDAVDEVELGSVETIEVVGKLMSPYNLGETKSSTKTQRQFLEIPQIVSALPDSLMRDVGSRNYSDAIQLASSVSYLERNAGVTDELRLRGFAYPSLKVNGISAHAYVSPLDIAFIERIDVAKGPNSVIYGRMEPGGVINMVTKQPGNSTNSILTRIGSDDFFRTELDISLNAFEDTDVRFIGFIQRQGSAEELDLNDSEGFMIAASHQFEHGGVLNINYRRQSQNSHQQFGQPVEGFDSEVQFFSNETGGFDVVTSRDEDIRAKLKIDRDSLNISMQDWLIGDWTADFHLQYDYYQSDSAIDYPSIESFVIDVNGQEVSNDNLTEALLNDPELLNIVIQGLRSVSVEDDNISFERIPFSYNTHAFSSEATIYKSSQLDSIIIEQLYGANLNRSKPESLIWQTHDTRGNFLPIEQNELLFDPDLENTNITDLNAGLFSQWVVNIKPVTLFFGARIDYLDFSTDSATGKIERDYTETSLRAGGVFSLSEQSSLYVNYSEAFSPQFSEQDVVEEIDEEVDGREETFATILFANPATSKQWELGIKQTWFDQRLHTSCALYTISKADIASDVVEQENQGAECDLAGSFGNGWHLTMGASVIDASIVEAEDEELIGNQPRMTPEKQLRFWLSKDVNFSPMWQSRIGIGYTYVDNRYVDGFNEDLLSSYQLIDMTISASYGDDVSLSLITRNLTDEFYTAGAFNAIPFWTNQGRERTIELQAVYRF